MAKEEFKLQAKELFINSKKSLSEISDILKISESTLRNWRKKDNWDSEEGKAKKLDKTKTKREYKPRKPKKKQASGNKNASAPKNNKNNLKTGEYETILFKTLTPEEMDLVSSITDNKSFILLQEIQLLTVREFRMLERINNIQDELFLVEKCENFTLRNKDNEVIQEHKSENLVNAQGVILQYEEALTRIQDKKIKCVESLARIDVAYERLKLDKGEISTNGESTIRSWLEATNTNKDEVLLLFDQEKAKIKGVEVEYEKV